MQRFQVIAPFNAIELALSASCLIYEITQIMYFARDMSQDKNYSPLCASPFKTVHFQINCKNNIDNVNET